MENKTNQSQISINQYLNTMCIYSFKFPPCFSNFKNCSCETWILFNVTSGYISSLYIVVLYPYIWCYKGCTLSVCIQTVQYVFTAWIKSGELEPLTKI